MRTNLGVKLILALLCGHWLLRRTFAHVSLAVLYELVWRPAPHFLQYAYITDVVLLLLLPLAAFHVWRERKAGFQEGLRRPRSLELAGLLPVWGLVAIGLAYFTTRSSYTNFIDGSVHTHDTYLILRQSMLAGYAVFFIYTVVFFGVDQRAARAERNVRIAVITGIAAAIVCAAADVFRLLGGGPKPNQYFDEAAWGQATLPVAILGLSLLIVSTRSWYWRLGALLPLALVGWRQGLRLQSVVPAGLACALVFYLLLGLALACRRQFTTLKRAVLVIAVVGLCVAGYKKFHQFNADDLGKVQSWSVSKYADLLELYDKTSAPAYPTDVWSHRAPFRSVGELPLSPEERLDIYKLDAVFRQAGETNVGNDIWRLLVWKRMWRDWRAGEPVIGAGPGKPWFYRALYYTPFHYGEARLGLDPHNSYLNLLYRYGAIGLGLFALLSLSVLAALWKALAVPRARGDVWLEGLALYFVYIAVFAFFTNTLESPPYAVPFWCALGLVYVRARQVQAAPPPSQSGITA